MQRDLETVDIDALLRALEQHIQAEPVVGTAYWRVTSGTEAGRYYSLHADELGVDCSCPAGQYDRSCKHAALVVALRTGELRVTHSRWARHIGHCGERCGHLPIRRVAIGGVCVVDPDPHFECAARLRLVPVRQTTASRPSVA